jgi:hypothetical protein
VFFGLCFCIDDIRRGLGTAERHTALMNQGQAPPVKETEDAVWAFERCVELIEWCLGAHPKPIPSFYFRNLGGALQGLYKLNAADP